MLLTEGETVRSACEAGEIAMRGGYSWLNERGPIVAAIGAPSTLAADLASEFGITLVAS